MATLYALTDELLRVEQWIQENADIMSACDGMLPDELLALLDSAQEEFEAKAERVALMVLSYKADVKVLKEEIKRLQGKLKTAENAEYGLREYLRIQMKMLSKDKIKTAVISFWRQLSARTVRYDMPPDTVATLDVVHKRHPDLVTVEFVPSTYHYTLNKEAILHRVEERTAAQLRRELWYAENPGAVTSDEELDQLIPMPKALPDGLKVTQTEFLNIR